MSIIPRRLKLFSHPFSRVTPFPCYERQDKCRKGSFNSPRPAYQFRLYQGRAGRDCCKPRVRDADHPTNQLYRIVDGLLPGVAIQGQQQSPAYRSWSRHTDDAATDRYDQASTLSSTMAQRSSSSSVPSTVRSSSRSSRRSSTCYPPQFPSERPSTWAAARCSSWAVWA